MHTLTLTFQTLDELRAFISAPNPTPASAAVGTAAHAVAAQTVAETAPAEPPKERKPRAKKNTAPVSEAAKVETEDAEDLSKQVAEVEKAEATRQESTKPAVAVPSAEDVRAAIVRLLKAKGQQAAADVLAEFGAKNVSAIAEEKRGDVIAALDKKAVS
jgi:hypothetical protein